MLLLFVLEMPGPLARRFSRGKIARNTPLVKPRRLWLRASQHAGQLLTLRPSGLCQSLGVLDVVYSLPDQVGHPVLRLAVPIVETASVQLSLSTVIALAQGFNLRVVPAHFKYSPAGPAGGLRQFTDAGQDQGIGGPLGGAPRLFRRVAELAGIQLFQGIGVERPGIGENSVHLVRCYHSFSPGLPCAGGTRTLHSIIASNGNVLKRVIIDTDPGVDDAAAIFFALASPELSVEAITTVYGNGPVEVSTANARRILGAAGRLDIPIFQGAGKPLLREPTSGWASQVHGKDGLGEIDFPLPPEMAEVPSGHHAVLETIRRVMESPGEITLLALGRLTNLALALSIEPGLAQAVEQVIVMGGAVSVGGNVSAVASANLYEDPEAAAIVYTAGAPLVQVGMDVCNRVEFTRQQVGRIAGAGTPSCRLLAAATPFIQSYYRGQGMLAGEGNVRYNDVPAAAYAAVPELFQARDMYVTIETHSELTRGQTVVDRRRTRPGAGPDSGGRPANATVCLEVDAAALTELFTERVSGYGAK